MLSLLLIFKYKQFLHLIFKIQSSDELNRKIMNTAKKRNIDLLDEADYNRINRS